MIGFSAVVRHINGMDYRLRGALFFKPHIQHFESLPDDQKRPYYKYPVCGDGESGKKIYMIFWAPNGSTRPHSHGGSPARIRVLHGILCQEVFNLTVDTLGRRLVDSTKELYGLKKKEIIEQPGIIHKISNPMGIWVVSLHEFDRDFTMEIHDFDRNLRWLVRGDEDTLGDPPENAVPIWLDRVGS